MNSIFAERRKRFAEQLGSDGVAVIPAGREVTRSYDTHFPFRQANNFAYLTGFPEPEAVAVIAPNHPEHKFVLFVRPRDKEREIWDGRRFGPEGAKEHFGADAAYPLAEFDEKLPLYLENQKVIHAPWGQDPEFDKRLHRWLKFVRMKSRLGITAPTRFYSTVETIDEMRSVKDRHCIEKMRIAGKLSMEAHRHGMKVTKPGMNESALQAEMEHYCRVRGAQAMAYNSIVASGDNANILHYNENNMEMRDGDLVLVDLGCEFDWYASDITRTWPVNGKFTPEQKLIYDIVLESQRQGIDALRVGNSVRKYHEVCALVLADGLIDLGILKGSAETHMRVKLKDDTETKFADDEAKLEDFYMHGAGHSIGMDVHDCGSYRPGGEWLILQEGHCSTVEPGLYFSADNPKAPEKFRGIGIRIEDDILVTKKGPENLTAGLPRTTEEVEAACRGE